MSNYSTEAAKPESKVQTAAEDQNATGPVVKHRGRSVRREVWTHFFDILLPHAIADACRGLVSERLARITSDSLICLLMNIDEAVLVGPLGATKLAWTMVKNARAGKANTPLRASITEHIEQAMREGTGIAMAQYPIVHAFCLRQLARDHFITKVLSVKQNPAYYDALAQDAKRQIAEIEDGRGPWWRLIYETKTTDQFLPLYESQTEVVVREDVWKEFFDVDIPRAIADVCRGSGDSGLAAVTMLTLSFLLDHLKCQPLSTNRGALGVLAHDLATRAHDAKESTPENGVLLSIRDCLTWGSFPNLHKCDASSIQVIQAACFRQIVYDLVVAREKNQSSQLTNNLLTAICTWLKRPLPDGLEAGRYWWSLIFFTPTVVRDLPTNPDDPSMATYFSLRAITTNKTPAYDLPPESVQTCVSIDVVKSEADPIKQLFDELLKAHPSMKAEWLSEVVQQLKVVGMADDPDAVLRRMQIVGSDLGRYYSGVQDPLRVAVDATYVDGCMLTCVDSNDYSERGQVLTKHFFANKNYTTSTISRINQARVFADEYMAKNSAPVADAEETKEQEPAVANLSEEITKWNRQFDEELRVYPVDAHSKIESGLYREIPPLLTSACREADRLWFRYVFAPTVTCRGAPVEQWAAVRQDVLVAAEKEYVSRLLSILDEAPAIELGYARLAKLAADLVAELLWTVGVLPVQEEEAVVQQPAPEVTMRDKLQRVFNGDPLTDEDIQSIIKKDSDIIANTSRFKTKADYVCDALRAFDLTPEEYEGATRSIRKNPEVITSSELSAERIAQRVWLGVIAQSDEKLNVAYRNLTVQAIPNLIAVAFRKSGANSYDAAWNAVTSRVEVGELLEKQLRTK